MSSATSTKSDGYIWGYWPHFWPDFKMKSIIRPSQLMYEWATTSLVWAKLKNWCSFFQRSLPAVRQLTPNSQLFIQQCAQLKPSDSDSTKAANQKPTASISSALKPNQPTKTAQLVNPAHFYSRQCHSSWRWFQGFAYMKQGRVIR